MGVDCEPGLRPGMRLGMRLGRGNAGNSVVERPQQVYFVRSSMPF